MSVFLTKPTLTNDCITLRPFTEKDALRMFEIISIPEVVFLTGSADSWEEINNPDTSPDTFQKVLEWYKSLSDRDLRLDLAIVYQDELIGEVVLNEYNPEKQTANFRVLMDPAFTSQGIGTLAIQMFLQYCSRNLPLKTITLGVFDFNHRAQRVYEKVGFVETSRIKDDYVLEGASYDSLEMTLDTTTYQ